jgi:hypothetical protein
MIVPTFVFIIVFETPNHIFLVDCIGPGAAVMCEKCQISEQCSYGMMCCPHKKLCVKDSSSECEENEGAKCAPGCPDEDVHSKFNKCTCGDTRFPNAWAPTCGSNIIMKKIFYTSINIFK